MTKYIFDILVQPAHYWIGQPCAKLLCRQQATADLQVEQVVKNVESALQSKLLKTQALAQGLEQSLSAVSHEFAGLSRSQQRLTVMAQRLQEKLAVNKARQQVGLIAPAPDQTYAAYRSALEVCAVTAAFNQAV